MDDCGGNHGQGGESETSGDTLDWGEKDSGLAKSWVDDKIHDWNEDDDEQWVQVGDNIVWCSSELHSGGLGSQVVGHLPVCQPVNWVPQEDLAGRDTTADLIDPSVIERHPIWLVWSHVGWLDLLPKSWSLGVLVESDWVPGFLALEGQVEKLHCLSKDGSLWWGENVVLLCDGEDWHTGDENDGWQHEREPETDVLLSENHGYGTAKGADVDEEVEVKVDAADSLDWIDDDALAILKSLNVHSLGVLLSNERRDVRFKTSDTDTHDNDTNGESRNGTIRVDNDWRNSGHNQNDVTEDGDEDGKLDGHVTT